MLHVLTANHMGEVDRLTIERYGITGPLLMENAAVGAVTAMLDRFDLRAGKTVRIFCGKGNNGGDGAAVARQLWTRGLHVEVWLFGRRGDTRGDARLNFDIVHALAQTETTAVRFVEITTEAEFSAAVADGARRVALYVDALFGTGLSRAVTGLPERAIAFLNAVRTAAEDAVPVVALDIPSGLAADDPTFIGPHVTADLTVTFTAPKPANVLPPACNVNGEVRIVRIGSPDNLLDETDNHRCSLRLVERSDIAAFLAATRRSPNAHKGSVGHALIVAGSVGKTGAAALAAAAVLRAGAGLVTAVTPRSAQPVLAAACVPEVMTQGVADTPEGTFSADAAEEVLALSAARDVTAAGPGITPHQQTRAFVEMLADRGKTPLILDADALNCLAPWPARLRGTADRPIILTPHPGEMARLLGLTTSEIVRERVTSVRKLAEEHALHVVLKGQRTLIAAPNGDVYINPTGNAGMATAGSGDVLTGILAGILAQAPNQPLSATIASVFLHGLAGDHAARKTGRRALTASDITASLGDAFSEFDE